MVAIKENNKVFWLLMLISFICFANGRQIRYSRYNTEVIEDTTISADNQILEDENEVEATVREIKLAPYPASGFRPSRAFPLPNESNARNEQGEIESQVTDSSIMSTTTETIDFTTTTQVYDSETTTNNYIEEDDLSEDDSEKVEGGDNVLAESEKPKAPYPAAGFKPRIPFLLPTNNLLRSKEQEENKVVVPTELPTETEVKPPYPPSGYRPSKAFLLPSEQLQLDEETKNDNSNHPVCGSSTNPLAPKPLDGAKEDPDSEPINFDSQGQHKLQKQSTKNDNSNHPVCGSSTNPLAPRPLDGEKEDPDSEPINIDAVVQQRFQKQRAVVIPVRFSVHPVLLTRPLVYSAPITAAW